MAHYRKIDPRMWNDEKFRTLSTEGKLAFVLLLTHPHMTALGAMRASIPGLAAELGGKGFAEGFREVFAKGLAKHDESASCVYLPRFLKYNPPESPNVVKAWAHSIDLIPECNLKSQLIQEVKGYAEALTEGFAKALPEAFAKAMPNQEQEQEHEQQDGCAPFSAKGKKAKGEMANAMPEPLELPANLNRQAWDEWVAYRRERRLPVGATALRKHLKALTPFDAATQQAMIDAAIGSSWQGLYAPKGVKPAPVGKPPCPPMFVDGVFNLEHKAWMEKWG